ncbi:MAG: zinc-binding dehydrogenase [Thermoleophilaceae bacterium]|nr:zinc-binding dehydrogenase [Thermoleophilaceae bacterium]
MLAATISDGAISAAVQPDPVAGAGELLVRVRAAGLNGGDILQRAGAYPPPPGYPLDIPGLEFAGEVAGVGEGVRRFAAGDRVMTITGGGGQAELAVVHESMAMPVPDSIDWPAAGGFPEVFLTAHDALFTQAELRPGERLLINGAAGGVGTAAIQLAKNAGAFVVASVRDAAVHDSVRALGADEVVLPDAAGDHEPFDVVLELVGGPNIAGAIKGLAMGGRIVVIGVGGGFKTEINLLAIMGKRAVLRGSTLRARPLEEKALASRAVEREVLPALANGSIVVPVMESFPLPEVAAAYDRFTAGSKLGKIVLTA